MRGFFEIGIYHSKSPCNIGTLWRSAYQLGAAGIFTVGARYTRQCSDTLKAPRHIPLRHYSTLEELIDHLPHSCPLIGIEMGGKDLTEYRHPERACYLLGAEDHGLPPKVMEQCHGLVSLPSIRTLSYNVAVAGSLVMFDRVAKYRQTYSKVGGV
jgi:tRNA G18 (ribose-2'-O)-methylase SpoU